LGWRQIVRALGKKGFYAPSKRQSRPHDRPGEEEAQVTVPRHETVAAGAPPSIIEQSGMTGDEFLGSLG